MNEALIPMLDATERSIFPVMIMKTIGSIINPISMKSEEVRDRLRASRKKGDKRELIVTTSKIKPTSIHSQHWNLAKVIMHYRTEEDMLAFLRHPAAMVGSDGSVMDPVERPGSLPHPRSFGYAPRILGRYVRDQGALSLEDAVYKLSGAVANLERTSGTGLNLWNRELIGFDPAVLRVDPSLADAWAEGERMAVDEAVADALEA